MKKVIRLTESDLTRIVKRVIKEENRKPLSFNVIKSKDWEDENYQIYLDKVLNILNEYYSHKKVFDPNGLELATEELWDVYYEGFESRNLNIKQIGELFKLVEGAIYKLEKLIKQKEMGLLDR